MRFADTLIAPDKRGERDRFGRGKGRIPPGAMLHCLDGPAVGVLIFIGCSLPHKLLSGLWMLALAEFCKVLGRYGPGKSELPRQSPLPFPCNDVLLRPIVLLFCGEFLLVGDKLYNLSAPEADTVRKYICHWTDRFQVSPEEFCKTFYDQQTGRTKNAARIRDLMNEDSNILSQQDIDVFAHVACAELYEAEKNEVEDWKRARLYGSDAPVPRTIADVVDEINAQLAAKG